jgi:hypothetical protein
MYFQLSDLSVYAVQRTAGGRWLLRTLSDNPHLPPTILIAAIDEAPPSSSMRPRNGSRHRRLSILQSSRLDLAKRDAKAPVLFPMRASRLIQAR